MKFGGSENVPDSFVQYHPTEKVPQPLLIPVQGVEIGGWSRDKEFCPVAKKALMSPSIQSTSNHASTTLDLRACLFSSHTLFLFVEDIGF